ncbi:MAG TPA: carboxypeptidase regulatory-like domain-containing protein [Vicinamibacterales bacterium]|nr:carboxypeptidase regulatory-like domain-containing protein [Vicinamibacterales bacterium]
MLTKILCLQRLWFVAVFLLIAASANAQLTTSIRGTVLDEQRAAIPGATVTLTHAASGLERVTTTDASGVFELPNLPLGAHDLAVSLPGFTTHKQRIDATSAIPVTVSATLALGGFTDTVQVIPTETAIDESSAGTRHSVSVTRIERMPVAVSSRGIEAVLVAFPGFAQNANGAIHPRGAHNQMTFLVDGLAISDQLTGAFANSLDVAVVQTAELLTGNIPAEFGSKVSGVAVLNSRSGRGTGRPLTGAVSIAGGGFRTAQGSVQLGGEHGRVGYFGSVTAMRTDRFLDQVSLDNLHNAGQFARGFGRVDIAMSDRTHVRTHVMGGGSRFELANQRSQHAAGQDQRQQLDDLSVWTTMARTIGTASAFEATAGYRSTAADLLPSAGDTPVTAAQDRRLSTYTLSTRYHRSRGAHQLRVGADVQRFPVAEHFSMAITSPTFNVPGSDSYNAALLPYDLTRGGSHFTFDDAQTGTQLSAFVQSTLAVNRWSFNLGLRHDEYRFLVNGRQLQPRLGVAYSVLDDRFVLRASYNRNYQTPPNENLLLSNSEVASRLAPDSVREALGSAYRPIQPERQDVYETGAQLSIGFATVDGAVYKKISRDQQDNNNFFDTGIIFPTTLSRIDVTGAEVRLTVLPRHGLSGSLSATTGRAISTPPFTGGLFLGQDAVDLLSAGPFAIDHDQRLGVQGQLTLDTAGPWWLSGTVRYDSGLVSNPSDPAEVAADPDYFDLLPFVNLGSDPPRVRPRTIVDVAAGIDLKDARGRKTWSAQLQATNLTNRTALYNFQSVFVGTRLVAPRSLSIRFARNF